CGKNNHATPPAIAERTNTIERPRTPHQSIVALMSITAIMVGTRIFVRASARSSFWVMRANNRMEADAPPTKTITSRPAPFQVAATEAIKGQHKRGNVNHGRNQRNHWTEPLVLQTRPPPALKAG